MEVNTLASKRAEMIGNAASCSPAQRSLIHKNATCACLRLPVAASCSDSQERKGDLWPETDIMMPNGYGNRSSAVVQSASFMTRLIHSSYLGIYYYY